MNSASNKSRSPQTLMMAWIVITSETDSAVRWKRKNVETELCGWMERAMFVFVNGKSSRAHLMRFIFFRWECILKFNVHVCRITSSCSLVHQHRRTTLPRSDVGKFSCRERLCWKIKISSTSLASVSHWLLIRLVLNWAHTLRDTQSAHLQ